MKKLLIIICVGIGIGFSSCYKDIVSPGPDPNGPPQSISFSGDLVPIFQKTCALSGCHAVGGHNPTLTADKAYTSLITGGFINIAVPTQSAIYLQTKPGGQMPTLNALDLRKLLDWIKTGAPNN